MSVKDIPIIFSAPMVRALLDGWKTMTRRIAWRSETDKRKMSFVCDGERPNPLARKAKGFGVQMGGEYWLRPTPWVGVRPGDRLWVREAWSHDGPDLETVKSRLLDAIPQETYGPYYRATEVAPDTLKWITPLHMPRWASRLTLIVTATKIERLQEISREDAIAEGLKLVSKEIEEFFRWPPPFDAGMWLTTPAAFAWLWRQLHGPDSWDANPEVVAFAFEVHKANIDTLPKSEAA